MSGFEWYYSGAYRRHAGCPEAREGEDGLVVDATDGPVPDWQCVRCGAVSSDAARGVYRECDGLPCEAFDQGLVHAHRVEG